MIAYICIQNKIPTETVRNTPQYYQKLMYGINKNGQEVPKRVTNDKVRFLGGQHRRKDYGRSQ